MRKAAPLATRLLVGLQRPATLKTKAPLAYATSCNPKRSVVATMPSLASKLASFTVTRMERAALTRIDATVAYWWPMAFQIGWSPASEFQRRFRLSIRPLTDDREDRPFPLDLTGIEPLTAVFR